MDATMTKHCPSCGKEIQEGSSFCEHCGTRIGATGQQGMQPLDARQQATQPPPIDQGTTRSPQIEDYYDGFKLPSVDIAPRLGRSLSLGFDLLSGDFFGGVLVAFLYTITTYVVSMVPIVGNLLMFPLMIGFIAWAEERRRGLVTNIGTLFRVGFNRIGDALIMGLVFMLMGLVLAFPLVVAYIMFYIWIVTTVIGAAVTAGTGNDPTAWLMASPALFGFMMFWIVAFLLVAGPIMSSMSAQISWAIAHGVEFSRAFTWAWERIKRNFYGWWLSGLALTFIGGFGVVLCWVGSLVTLPWTQLAWVELCADEGDG